MRSIAVIRDKLEEVILSRNPDSSDSFILQTKTSNPMPPGLTGCGANRRGRMSEALGGQRCCGRADSCSIAARRRPAAARRRLSDDR